MPARSAARLPASAAMTNRTPRPTAPATAPHNERGGVIARARSRVSRRSRTLSLQGSRTHHQPHQPLRVTRVGLDLVLRGALDLPRRRDKTPDPGRRQRPRQPTAGWASLVDGSPRPAQADLNATTSAVSPLSRCTVISRDSASTTHATTFAAYTSSPTQLRTFAMVGTPSVWCCRRPHRSSPSACLHPNARQARGGCRPRRRQTAADSSIWSSAKCLVVEYRQSNFDLNGGP